MYKDREEPDENEMAELFISSPQSRENKISKMKSTKKQIKKLDQSKYQLFENPQECFLVVIIQH